MTFTRGSVTKRVLCIPVERTEECKTRGEGAPGAVRPERDAGRARRCTPWRGLVSAGAVAQRVLCMWSWGHHPVCGACVTRMQPCFLTPPR